MRPSYTKYSSTGNNNQVVFRRVGSPNQIKKNINNVESNRQQISSQLDDNKSHEKFKYNLKNANQKSKMVNENDEKSKVIGLGDKNILSKSKDRKDYITANIANLAKKKEQKRNDSINSKKSNSQKTEKGLKNDPQQIYITKYDVKTKKINQQYATKNSKQSQQNRYSSPSMNNSNNTLKQQKIQKQQTINEEPSIQYHYNNETLHQESKQHFQPINSSSFYNQSKYKPIQIIINTHDDKIYKKKQIKLENQDSKYNNHHNNNNDGYTMNGNSRQIDDYNNQSQKISSNISIPSNKKIMTQASKIQHDLQKQYQQKFIQQLTLKLKKERQQFNIRLHKLQKDKQIIQLKNTKLIQSQFNLKNELDLTIIKNGQLQRQLQKYHNFAYKNQIDNQKMNNNNDRMFKQLENKYNQLLTQYRGKIKQNAELNVLLNQKNQKYYQITNRQKTLEQQINTKNYQLQNIKKIQQLKINQFKQKYQFLLKQKQLKMDKNNNNNLQKQYKNSINQLQKQLNIKNKQINILIKQNQQLYQRSKHKQQIQSILESKILQNNNFINELNKNKKLIGQMLNKHGEQVLNLSQEIQQKQRMIQKLKLNIQEINRNQKMNKLAYEAKNQLYGGKDGYNKQKDKNKGQNQNQNAFQEMIYRQSQDTNKFKKQLYIKEDQIYQLKLQIDELRQKVRRLQQDAQINARTYASNMNNLRQSKQATQMILKKRIAALESIKNH